MISFTGVGLRDPCSRRYRQTRRGPRPATRRFYLRPRFRLGPRPLGSPLAPIEADRTPPHPCLLATGGIRRPIHPPSLPSRLRFRSIGAPKAVDLPAGRIWLCLDGHFVGPKVESVSNRKLLDLCALKLSGTLETIGDLIAPWNYQRPGPNMPGGELVGVFTTYILRSRIMMSPYPPKFGTFLLTWT